MVGTLALALRPSRGVARHPPIMAHAMSAAAPVVRTPAVIRRARVPGRASNRCAVAAPRAFACALASDVTRRQIFVSKERSERALSLLVITRGGHARELTCPCSSVRTIRVTSPHLRVGSVRASAGGRLAAPATSPLSERPNAAPADPFLALKGAMVHRATDGSLVDLSTTWSADEKCVVVFLRSFG